MPVSAVSAKSSHRVVKRLKHIDLGALGMDLLHGLVSRQDSYEQITSLQSPEQRLTRSTWSAIRDRVGNQMTCDILLRLCYACQRMCFERFSTQPLHSERKELINPKGMSSQELIAVLVLLGLRQSLREFA